MVGPPLLLKLHFITKALFPENKYKKGQVGLPRQTGRINSVT